MFWLQHAPTLTSGDLHLDHALGVQNDVENEWSLGGPPNRFLSIGGVKYRSLWTVAGAFSSPGTPCSCSLRVLGTIHLGGSRGVTVPRSMG